MRIRIATICWLASLAASCVNTTLTSPSEVTVDPNSFSSVISPGTGASREFTLTSKATVAVTLTTTSPSGVALGLGIGIPRANGSCALSAGVQTVAGSAAQISVTAEAGTYCARVYDPGTVTEETRFTIVISRP